MRRVIFGALASISSFLVISAVPFTARAANNTVVVTPQAMNGWTFIDDQHDTTITATGHMVPGPASPPLGVGSAELETSSSTDGQALMKNAYGGAKFANLTTATYSTYVKSGNNTVAPAVQFSVDKDVTDNDTSWQGRLVYEPYLNDSVTDNQWQTWHAESGKWWLSKSDTLFNSKCPASAPCTLTELINNFANIGVNGGVNQQILFKAGSGWTSDFVGNVDALTVAFSGSDQTTFDFEPYAVASNTDQCKKNGYLTVRDSSGQEFKNQGQCVSWVQHNVNGNGQQNNTSTGTY